MKIGSLDKQTPVAPVAAERKSGTTAGGASNTASSSSTVAISQEATALASAGGDGSFDAAKVDRISQSIKDGSFKPNAETIADKLIANAQELLTRTYG